MKTPKQKQNALLYSTINTLERINYPDGNRVAKEICDFSDYDQYRVEEVLSRLKNDEPWEYIRGVADFMGNQFIVNRDVLIPRLETEILVQKVIDEHPLSERHAQFVDLGTGSGPIIISLYQALSIQENNTFLGLDSSVKAIETAKENSKKILGQELQFEESDLLNNFKVNESVDQIIFIANLPYLTANQMDNAEQSVIAWEPAVALFGFDDDGLYLIRRFLDQTGEIDTPHTIYLELDPSQVDLIRHDYASRYSKMESFQDQFKQERFLYLES